MNEYTTAEKRVRQTAIIFIGSILMWIIVIIL